MTDRPFMKRCRIIRVGYMMKRLAVLKKGCAWHQVEDPEDWICPECGVGKFDF
jgi:hypothetical protein